MIRIAAIGTGNITDWVAAAIAEVPGIELAGVYSRDAARAASVATSLGARQSWSSLDDLLASDVDAVYVASPNAIHAEQTAAAIAAGKHVLVEKPATLTAAEFGALVERARERGVVLLEGMRSVHDPTLGLIRELLPRLGTVRRASFEYCQRSSRYDRVLAGERVNIFDPALGGGALNDIGVYPVAVLVALFGEPTRVSASRILLPTGADGSGVALATYPTMVADVAWSKITAAARPSQIEGERGTLAIDHITEPSRLVLRPLGGEPEVFGEARTNSSVPANIRHEIEAFVRFVGGADPAPYQELTMMALRTLEAIRAAG